MTTTRRTLMAAVAPALCTALVLLTASPASSMRMDAAFTSARPAPVRGVSFVSQDATPLLSPALKSQRLAAPLMLADISKDGGGGDGERSRQRGRTAVIARPKPIEKSKNKEEVENEPSWRVLLHNDDVSDKPTSPSSIHAIQG
eukprot:6000331-Pleurochrysis_carterae.AAC.2